MLCRCLGGGHVKAGESDRVPMMFTKKVGGLPSSDRDRGWLGGYIQ